MKRSTGRLYLAALRVTPVIKTVVRAVNGETIYLNIAHGTFPQLPIPSWYKLPSEDVIMLNLKSYSMLDIQQSF